MPATCGEPQFQHSGLRQIGQAYALGQSKFPRLYQVAQERFADALNQYVFVDYLVGAEMTLQTGDDFGFHQVDHLEGHTGHGNHHFGRVLACRMGVDSIGAFVGLWQFEPHARGSTYHIVNHCAATRHPGLLAVDGGELIASGIENAFNVGQGLFVFV